MSTCRIEVEEDAEVNDEVKKVEGSAVAAESCLARKEANFGMAAQRYYTPRGEYRAKRSGSFGQAGAIRIQIPALWLPRCTRRLRQALYLSRFCNLYTGRAKIPGLPRAIPGRRASLSNLDLVGLVRAVTKEAMRPGLPKPCNPNKTEKITMEILPGATFEPTLTAGVVHGMHKLPHSAE